MSALRDNSSKNKAIKCNRRPFEKIPIFIVEDHNNVLEFIYRCLGARRIPFTGNKIIHFDSHPDMTIPKYMPAEFVRDREKLLTTLSIENWLMPAAYAGHIDQLIWMKPDWANQIKDGDYEFRLGDHNGFIRCDSPLEYFLSEGTYQSACHLNNQRQINLRVFTLSDAQLDYQQQKQQPQQDSDDDVDSSDMRRIEFQNCVDDANEQFILDIDLDFFSTTNPFRQILNPAIYDAVKSLFKAHFFDKPFDANATDDELMAFTIERSRFIDALETIFKQLDQNINELDLTIPDALHAKKSQIIDLIRDIKNVNQSNEIAWMTIFDAGNSIKFETIKNKKINLYIWVKYLNTINGKLFFV